ncbi:MAG: hypothetical protein NTV01_21545 [Bacteroidia bacterium]|nr:hypothetical protein [Bacteroidia bacterium]
MAMRIRNIFTGLMFLALITSSCEENVQVFAPTEFIPVVYCLLNPEDTVQSVRVSRVFQDKRSRSEWDNEYDQYLADTLNRIYIETIDISGAHVTTHFKWIEQIRPANDSVFARTDLFTSKLMPSYSTVYQLYVYYPEIKKMVSGIITTLTRIQLVDPAIVPGRKMVIAPTQPYELRWYSFGESQYFQGIVDVNYLEEEIDQIVAKSIRMTLRPVLESRNDVINSQNINGRQFLMTLRDQIPVQADVRRKMADLDFTFYFGGPELALFVNSGLNPKGAVGQVVDFTNLDNARGLFSSISSIRIPGVPLAEQTIDTIALHELTRNLNFLRSHEDFK